MNIIMPVYLINEELLELTKNAIESLKGELIIIDNGSPIGQDYLKEKASVYIRNEENLGYPKAVNQGFEKATSDLIAVANNDIRISSNWESVAKEIFQEDSKVGSVHFRMIDYEEPIQLGYNTWIMGKERWCTSSFYVIRSDAKVLYDEKFIGGGYDDYDYWHRVRHLLGWKTAYTTCACYQHKHSSTQKALDDGESRREQDNKNKGYFIFKWGEEPDTLFAKRYPEQWKEDYWSFFKQL